jgi:hypothetical protein
LRYRPARTTEVWDTKTLPPGLGLGKSHLRTAVAKQRFNVAAFIVDSATLALDICIV